MGQYSHNMCVKLLFRILLFFSFLLSIHACGLLTHVEIGTRSAAHFTGASSGVDYHQLIHKQDGAFQAGLVYPDSFYSNICFAGYYHNVSEDTHWTPFVNASVNYIRKTYKRPWNEKGEKLVAFLLGVVSHQVADVLWHSLDINQGFLETMAMMNFNGTFSAAHNIGDFGGDVLNAYSLSRAVSKNWYVPVEDLWKIYNQLYGELNTVPAYVIKICSLEMYLGIFGEQLGVIDSLYPKYSSKSPFMLDQLYSYFQGGISDMAVWSALTWNRTIAMLDHGTQWCKLPYNPLFIRCRSHDLEPAEVPVLNSKSTKKASFLSSSAYPTTLENYDELILQELERQMQEGRHHQPEQLPDIIYESEMTTVKVPASTHRPFNQLKNKTQLKISPLVDLTLMTSKQSYSELGYYSLVSDLNSDGYQDIIVSAPSYSVKDEMYVGKVFSIMGSDIMQTTNSSIEDIANFSLRGFNAGGRFGESLAIVDINLDGRKDIVVSSPSVGRENLAYHGEVYVYLGNDGDGNGVLYGGQRGVPDIVIRCLHKYCNYGARLSVGDADGDGYDDLIIGSPMAPGLGQQRGMVQIFYSTRAMGSTKLMMSNEANITLHGKEDYEWFGYSHAIRKEIDGKIFFAVGSPGFRICHRQDCEFNDLDLQSAGKVSVFDLNFDIVSEILGHESFQQFGSSLNILSGWLGNENVLAVSSISAGNNESAAWQPGMVQYFKVRNLEKISTHYSDIELSRFGNSVVDSIDSDLFIITAPLTSVTYFNERETGVVYVYSKKNPEKMLGCFSLMNNFARFSYSLAVLPLHAQINNMIRIVAGAPHYTSASVRHGGSLVIATIKIPQTI